MSRTAHELRCFCSKQPILAMYGVDERGDLYIHLKVWKQHRLFGEIIVQGPARIQLHCRECFRWQNVTIRPPNKVTLEESKAPQFLSA